MAKLTLVDIGDISLATTALNTNNARIETAMEKTLSRDGTTPNEMNAVLDMNSHRITNLAEPTTNLDAARLQDVIDLAAELEGPQGPQGPKGDTGDQGPQGLKGDTGDTGAAATISAGTTSTLSPGSPATVTNVGTSGAAIFDFGIPQGAAGTNGTNGTDGVDGVDGQGVIAGGTTGQVLIKASNADYDTAWSTSAPLTDGDKGDITVASGGTVWTVDGGYVPTAGGSFTGPVVINTGLRFGHFAGSRQIDNPMDNTSGRVLDFDTTGVSTQSGDMRFFRNTNTSGARRVSIFRGDGSGTADHTFTSGTSGSLAQLCINGGNLLVAGNLAWHAGNTNDIVTNAKLANMAVNTIKGRITSGTGDPEDLTVSQVKTLLNVGVTDASNAAAGSLGEVVSTTFSSTAGASNTAVNQASISLTAGDWDVTGFMNSLPDASATMITVLGSLSTISATLGDAFRLNGSWVNGQGVSGPVPTLRVNVSATTTVYFVSFHGYSGGAVATSGNIYARRVR